MKFIVRPVSESVAVNDVKLAKQNVAWLALQEMGFVKPDPANPV